MSSHHIVREKQEPALLILGLEDFSFEHLGQLLEWSPTVIATAETAEQLQDNHIKIDLLIADKMPIGIQSDVKLVHSANKSHFETAITYLIEQGYTAVNIIADDDLIAGLTHLFNYADQIDIVIYGNEEKIYPVRTGFRKWKPANEKIRLLTKPEGLSFTGLKYIEGEVYLTEADGFFTLHFNQPPYVFVAEAI
jgi:thiamine pyrophosphokinase